MPKDKKITESQLVQYCVVGKPTKYDKKKHIPLLIKSFYKGDSIRQFCAQALISEKTFYNWLNKHKEFKHAYQIALNFAADFWERIPFENPEFNYPYLQAVMRHRFGFGKSITKIKDKETPIEIINAAQESLDEQKITSQEANQIADIALKKQQLLNNPLQQEQAQPNVSEEFVLKHIDKFNETMRHIQEYRAKKEA